MWMETEWELGLRYQVKENLCKTHMLKILYLGIKNSYNPLISYS